LRGSAALVLPPPWELLCSSSCSLRPPMAEEEGGRPGESVNLSTSSVRSPVLELFCCSSILLAQPIGLLSAPNFPPTSCKPPAAAPCELAPLCVPGAPARRAFSTGDETTRRRLLQVGSLQVNADLCSAGRRQASAPPAATNLSPKRLPVASWSRSSAFWSAPHLPVVCRLMLSYLSRDGWDEQRSEKSDLKKIHEGRALISEYN
jgi:hypothetical protein